MLFILSAIIVFNQPQTHFLLLHSKESITFHVPFWSSTAKVVSSWNFGAIAGKRNISNFELTTSLLTRNKTTLAR